MSPSRWLLLVIALPLIGQRTMFPPVRGLLPLTGGPLPPFDRQFPILDPHLPFLQPGLVLLSGHLTLAGLLCPHAALALLARLHDTMLPPHAFTPLGDNGPEVASSRRRRRLADEEAPPHPEASIKIKKVA